MPTRQRRENDLKSLEELQRRCHRFRFTVTQGGVAPVGYLISFECPSYVYSKEEKTVVRTPASYTHRVEISLGHNYPIEAPRITWQTEICHPNIIAGGPACIKGGLWDPERSLADVCRQLFEMAQYKQYDVKNALSGAEDAVAWVREQPDDVFPADRSPVFDREE